MNVLSFSSCFPSGAAPTEGIFVFDRLSAVAERAGVTVVHPVASCPLIGPVGQRRPSQGREQIGNLAVHHRRYSYLPGLLKRFDGYFYCRGLRRWAADWCRRNAPDLLDAHFVWPDGVGVSLIARRLRLPYVVTLRGTINPRWRLACFRGRIADALRRAAAVISVSGQMAEIAVALGVEPASVHVIPNGVDGRAFHVADKAAARRRLGLPEDRPVLVCVAALKRPKGQEDLIRALQAVRDRPLLVLVGAPADGTGCAGRLEALARRCGLDGQVRLAGAVGRKSVADYYNAADASVLPSRAEGCPNVVLESLACGTPVVATGVGAVLDLLRSEAAGLIVTPGDTAALARAITEALHRRWSRAAIRSAVEHRTWQAVADEVLEVFRRAAGS